MWELIWLLLAASPQDETPPRPPEKEHAPADASRDYVRFAFNFYDQVDRGGNPNLDEDMTVLEPMVLISKSLGERWTGTLKVQSDLISAASIEAGKRFPPGLQSGASGDQYFGLEAGAFYAWSDQTRIGAAVSYSTEYDYDSVGGNVRWIYDTESRNDTFVAKAGAFYDTLDLIRFTGFQTGTDTRVSFSAGLGWTHVLGPRTVGTVNWDITLQQGFLETPYNSVVAAGTEVTEELPDDRLRNAFHVRVRHLILEDLAVEPGIGVYLDDWGANAFNVEVNFHWEAIPGILMVRPSYRYHTQTEVRYFVSPTAAAIPADRTQDSDLAEFDSHTLGLKIIFLRVPFLGEDSELEVGFEYSLRSDNLDAFSVTFGYVLRWP